MKYDVCRYHLINTNKENLIFSGCIRKIANDPTIRINQIVAYDTSRYSNFIPRVVRIENQQIYYETDWVKSTSSLIQSINIASLNKWPYVFIFFNDVKLSNYFNDEVNESLSNINDFSILIINENINNKESENIITSVKEDFFFDQASCFLITEKYYFDILTKLSSTHITEIKDTCSKLIDNSYYLNKRILESQE